MDVKDLTKQFKDYTELLAYTDAQYKTILSQSKEINGLKEKITDLEKLLANSTPLIQDNSIIHSKVSAMSDEEAVAVMELAKLKIISLERDLSMEEAKKYQIYTQTLQSIRGKEKKKTSEKLEEPSDSELLALLDNK